MASLATAMLKLQKKAYCLSLLFISFFSNNMAFSHGETIELSHTPGGPVYLSQEQKSIIDLKLAKVSERSLAQILGLNGEIQLLANAQADVSVRVSGNVSALYANLGDTVTLGQPLVKIQSLLIGEPPPSVIIKAPMDGLIDARNISLGQAVQPNTVLFHISNRRQLLVIAKVYEEDLAKVSIGQEARLLVLSYPNHDFVGKLILIEPNLDPLTRTVNVQILLDNKQNLLKPGMFTRVNLILEKKKNTLSIPNAAILEANDEKFVFKAVGTHYERIEVTTGITDANFSEIKQGLAAGDEVVIQGNRQLYTLWLTGVSKPVSTVKDKP